jgi:hypothetical protein
MSHPRSAAQALAILAGAFSCRVTGAAIQKAAMIPTAEKWAAGSFRLVDQFGGQSLAACLRHLRPPRWERDYWVAAA